MHNFPCRFNEVTFVDKTEAYKFFIELMKWTETVSASAAKMNTAVNDKKPPNVSL